MPTLSPETMTYRNRHRSVEATVAGEQYDFQVRVPSSSAVQRFVNDNYRGIYIPIRITLPVGVQLPGAVNRVIERSVYHNGYGISTTDEQDRSDNRVYFRFIADIARVALGEQDRLSQSSLSFIRDNRTQTLSPAIEAVPGDSLHDLMAVRGTGLGWADNMTAFQNVYTAAREALVDKKAVFEAIDGDPMRGFASLYLDGFDGRTFGLEIEVDFPESYPYNTQKELLAQRLFDEGLTDSPRVHGWHWRGREQDNRSRTLGGGYTSTRNGWSVEFDRTVDDVNGQRGCEIVSPIMSNTRQWWEDITKILAIVQELGGAVSSRHGLHINLGARDFNDLATRNLYVIAQSFDATLIRLAHNPNVGNRHRGRTYCNNLYNITGSQGNRYFAREAIYNAGHRSIINLASFDGLAENKRVEFRLFDASLDVLRIQRYVMLAMAMMHTSVSMTTVIDNDGSFQAFANEHGVNNRRRTGEAWTAATLPVRRLVDLLRLSPEAAADVVALFTESRYSA